MASQLNYLDTKDQFKWYGDFKELIYLIRSLLEVTEDGEISEDPAHKMFTFKVGDVIVKWYSSTHTLQTQGSGYATLREKLGNLFSSKENLLALTPNCDIQQCPLAASDESTSMDCSSTSSQNLQSVIQTSSNPTTCDGCSIVKNNLQKVEQKFIELQHFVHSRVNMQIVNSSTPDNQERLLQENIALQNEVKKLKEQLVSERLSNARATNIIKTLENERDSLVTAIKLLNEDQVRSSPTNAPSPQVDQSSPLHHDENTGWTTVGKRREPAQQAHSTNILGDSMIKYIDTRRMKSNGNNVFRKCFPGSSTEDMKHYMVPSLAKEPDQVVIHIGTNDFKREPRVLVDNIIELANEAEGPDKKRKVFVSSIICRQDSTLNNKVRQVNNLLSSACRRNSLSFIDNSNILVNHLNSDGIHLNRKGTALLVKNYSSAIRNSSSN